MNKVKIRSVKEKDLKIDIGSFFTNDQGTFMLIEWSDPYQEVHESYALLNINNGKIISKFNTLEDANFYVHNSKNNFINLGNNVKIKIKTKAKL